MGLFSSSLRALVPERKDAVAASIPTWQQGVEQQPQWSYDRGAREGYMLDELVYACIEFRATSTGEPPICAFRNGSKEKLELDQHEALRLLNHPNPFMGRTRFWATIGMSMDIGGNAYVEKVRSAAGKVVELWPLRPDRMTVIPSEQSFIGGYMYRLGERPFPLRAEDVIHFKTRHPLDDFYGLPPLHVLAGRVDLDVWARKFTEAFFRNAGVPAGLLNFVRSLTETDREAVRRNFQRIYGGQDGWHKLLVLDGGQATYEPMGLPMGASGAAMPELNELNETRILAAFGLTPSLISTMASLKGGNLAGGNRKSDRELFWESTMTPLFAELDSTLTMSLAEDFPDLDRLEHDLSTVRALQEDVDARHKRARENWAAGLLTWKRARVLIDEPEEPEKDDSVVILASTMVPTPSTQMIQYEEPPPDQVPVALPGGAPNGALPAPQPAANGQMNGAAH